MTRTEFIKKMFCNIDTSAPIIEKYDVSNVELTQAYVVDCSCEYFKERLVMCLDLYHVIGEDESIVRGLNCVFDPTFPLWGREGVRVSDWRHINLEPISTSAVLYSNIPREDLSGVPDIDFEVFRRKIMRGEEDFDLIQDLIRMHRI